MSPKYAISVVVTLATACEVGSARTNDTGHSQAAGTNGLVATYFDDLELSGPATEQIDDTVDFAWDRGAPAGLSPDTFSVRWVGFVEPRFTETYQFHVTSDDGARLWVADEALVDEWTNHGPRTYSGSVALEAGQRYPLVLEYYENTGGAMVRLEWSSASQSREVVPASQLFTTDDDDGGATIYEAEDRTASSGCAEASNHAGFTGSGFMDYGGQGTWIEWNDVDAPRAGTRALTFRYANGSGSPRRASVIVNGNAIGEVPFAPTGAWTTWDEVAIDAPLRAGTNAIRVIAATSRGGPNLDHLDVIGGGDTPPGGGDPGEDNSLPVEVLGPAGTTAERTFTVANPAAAVALALECHRCGYRDRRFDSNPDLTKAGLRINGGPLVPLKHYTGGSGVVGNTDLALAHPAAAYGGIGGGFTTVRMTLPADGLVAGANTITFEHVNQRGPSIGFRILSIDVLDADGDTLLAPDAFSHTDPRSWTPPLDDPADIAEGARLWSQNDLLYDPGLDSLSERPGGAGELDGRIWASCGDCHLESGWDLAYFHYSNHSIIARSVFHGLTERQGQQIASYIRTLADVPEAELGRPWNPPFQPGPGLDARAPHEWAAGAGLSAVLPRDEDMHDYLFPRANPTDQEVAQVASRLGTLNMRELPVALQMPDWNSWLPVVHPRDAFDPNAAAIRRDYRGRSLSAPYWDVLYETAEANPTPDNLGAMVVELGEWLRRNDGGGTLCFTQGTGGGPGFRVVNSPVIQAVTLGDVLPASLSSSDCVRLRDDEHYAWPAEMAKTGLHAWAMTKLFEVIHTKGLETRSQALADITLPGGERVSVAEARGWVTGSRFNRDLNVFSRAPHYLSFNSDRFFDQSSVVGAYENTAWYHLQLVVNPGYRDTAPSHFTYTHHFVAETQDRSGVPQSYRFWAGMIKMRQVQTNGRYGVEDGFDMRTAQPYAFYSNFHGDTDVTSGVGNTLWRQLAEAMILDLVEDAQNATWDSHWRFANQNRRVQHEDSTRIDDETFRDGSRRFIRVEGQGTNTYRVIPDLRRIGVSESTLDALIDWAESLWHNDPGAWAAVRS